MKKLVTAIVFCGFMVAPLASVSAGQEGAWFDLENCKMCKNMSSEKGLMENMQWENIAINSGSMSVTVVSASHAEAYARAQEKMHETSLLLRKGEKMDLCGYCDSFGALMRSGAKIEQIDTNAGHVMLVTSDNEDVVKKIHAHVERTNAEMAKMMQAEDPHAGHSHD